MNVPSDTELLDKTIESILALLLTYTKLTALHWHNSAIEDSTVWRRPLPTFLQKRTTNMQHHARALANTTHKKSLNIKKKDNKIKPSLEDKYSTYILAFFRWP